jgi:hypothetical protein
MAEKKIRPILVVGMHVLQERAILNDSQKPDGHDI